MGKDAADASSMRLRKETELNNGDATVPEIAANGHRSVAGSVADYLEETELTKNETVKLDLADESSTGTCHFSYCSEPYNLTSSPHKVRQLSNCFNAGISFEVEIGHRWRQTHLSEVLDELLGTAISRIAARR